MNYTFEYFFIPMIVDNSNKDDYSFDDATLFDSFDSVELFFSEQYPSQSEKFDWEHLCIRKEMKSDVEYWFFTFPEPQSEPEARWGIIVHYNDQPYKYYTFEQGDNDLFFFCQVNNKQHQNYGSHSKEFSEKQFIELALQQAAKDVPDNSCDNIQ